MNDQNQFHLYVRSDDSNDLFPANGPFNFTVQLPHPLVFSKVWEWDVCLVELSCPKPDNVSPKTLTVKSNLVGHTIVDGSTYQILRRFFVRGFDGQVFGDQRYIPVLYTTSNQLSFSITADNINSVSLSGSGVTILTLKFRRIPKWT